MNDILKTIQDHLDGHLPDGATVTNVANNVSYIEYLVDGHVHRMAEAGVIELTGKSIGETLRGGSSQ